MKKTSQDVHIDGRSLSLTSLEKPMWPDTDITKADLIHYYTKVAPVILPHLEDRPLTLTRHPHGVGGEAFYQKNAPSYTPEWIERFGVVGDGHTTDYILCQERATLVWLANQAAIGLHPWLSTIDAPAHPNILVFDLDPAEGATFAQVRRIAALVRVSLQQLGLTGYPKLSGATGVHIYVPIKPRYTYKTTSGFAGRIGELIVSAAPDDATNRRRVRERDGHVYIDHLQNLPGKTIAAPFSVRPRPGAPVSMPVTWDEIERLRPDAFKLPEAADEALARASLFAPVYTTRQRLEPALDALGLRSN